MKDKLIVSTSPHFHGKTSTPRIMLDVLIALYPAALAAACFYGWNALIIMSVCVGSAVLSEFLFNKIAKKPQTVGDLSAIVTGLLLALSLPETANIWHCIVGSAFAIICVKCVFGGIGRNFANPAITARVFLVIAFSDAISGGTHTVYTAPEIASGATPLAVLGGAEGTLPSILDMLIGNRGGAIGESCAIALLIGLAYLLIRKVISFETPLVYVGSVFILSLIFKQDIGFAIYQILGGGLLLGAIFMATDYVTSPATAWGKVIFGVGAGLITFMIRYFGVYPEGVSFAILLMNIVTPFIDSWTKHKVFGKGGKQA